MGRDGGVADDELPGDRVLIEALGEQSQHLELALRQLRQTLRQRLLGGRGSGEEAPDAGDELVRIGRLEDVVVGADE